MSWIQSRKDADEYSQWFLHQPGASQRDRPFQYLKCARQAFLGNKPGGQCEYEGFLQGKADLSNLRLWVCFFYSGDNPTMKEGFRNIRPWQTV